MNLGKQLKRVKQQADHLFLRSDRTDVVGELRTAEEQAEELRLLVDACTKSLEKILHTHTVPEDKKLRKIPEYQAAEGLKEGLNTLPASTDSNDLLRNILERVVEAQQALGMDMLDFEDQVEKQVLNPLSQIIKDEFPSIVKQKKQLKQIGLDLDAAKTRLRSQLANPAQNTKIDTYREELEEAESKLDQARDTYACDIFSLLARHREVSQHICGYVELQREYLYKTLMRLDQILPDMKQQLQASSCSPVYGVPLHDHLRIVQKDIAEPIQVCVMRIIEVGLYEEGIFRVAGSASKIRRLKGAFDANLVTYETLALADEHDRDYDVHVVAGALKCYLRELPEPLLTHVLHDQWLEAVRQSDHQLRLKAMWMVVNQLPPANLANLRYIIKFLTKLAGNSASNKMSPSNIAIVIAPNLIWAQRENDEQPDLSTLGRNMSLTSEYRSVVENLVEYHDYFFKEEVDFGVIPRVPPSPSQIHTAPNGTVPPTPSAQQRVISHGHRRNVSADFGRIDTSGNNIPAVSNAGDCDSPKQPQRTKKKQAPKPPPTRPASSHGVHGAGQNAQENQGTAAVINTSSASASPETQPKESSGGPPGTPAPATRLHHSNSIKRPTAEPPRPPSLAPPKPPRPSPPIVESGERPSKVQSESNTETKLVPLGFEQMHTAKDMDSSDDSEVFLRKKSDGDGPPPIGFAVEDDLTKEEGTLPPKTSSSFRQSLENVLQQQAAGQPVALPRHSASTASTSSEGDSTPQAVLPIPRTSSGSESVRPVMPPTPVQRTTVPASTAAATLPRLARESNQTAAERPEPMQRVDKPALPEKPHLNRSTIVVDHSKPQVPERPSVVPPRPSSVGSVGNLTMSSDGSGLNEPETHDEMVLSQTSEDPASSSSTGTVHPLPEKTPHAVDKQQVSVVQTNPANAGDGSTNLPEKPWKPPKPDKPPQLLARPPSFSSEQLDAIAPLNSHHTALKSGGSGKFTWPPSTDTAASTPSEEEQVPDSTNL
ncbi:SH3 domain-binding protein 1-like isoform X1 [Macrobrachium rosenbergii]|uniref:SH3 domain-binding protein 1-like isoform X1 n=1 Tax=Macrobrachium rosenbergii TaxID=79674 RepID=UPI0034D79BC9